jgi:hypothetical protein
MELIGVPPISDWDEQASFDSADACEQAKTRLWRCGAILNNADSGDPKEGCNGMARTRSQAKSKEEESTIASIATQDMMAKCIATDDPRLKGN